MSDTPYMKPLPVVDADSQAYWAAAQRHELMLPRCDDCGTFVFYPRALCPHCKSQSLTWNRLSGRGTVYSFTVVRFAITPAHKDDVPYVVALIDTEEGPRIMANILGCDPGDVQIGMSVAVTFTDATPDVTLPQFRPR